MIQTLGRRIPPFTCILLMAVYSPLATNAEMSGEWERSITLGFNQARGNTETLQHRVAARAEKLHDDYEWLMDSEWTYGESEKEKNAEFGRLSAEHKRLLTKRAFVNTMAEISYDAIAKLDYRVVAGPALGYFLLRDESIRLSAEAGPSYVAQKLDGESQGYIALRVAQDFDYRINKRVRIWQGTEYIPRIDDFDQFLLNSEIGVESALTATLSLGLTLQHRHNSRPADDAKRNDLYLVSTLKYTF